MQNGTAQHCIGAVSISSGDHRARVLAKRDRLILANLDLVPPIAGRIHATLPPSFDLDDLIQAGNLGLLHAATRYRPQAHNDTPFSAFARPTIFGTIMDTVRRRQYTENTRPALEDAAEPIAPAPPVEISIDRGRLRARVSAVAAEVLSKEESAVIDAYYGTEMPSLTAVAVQLGIPEWRAWKAHAEAVQKLRVGLTAA